jgi:hypothetical protein
VDFLVSIPAKTDGPDHVVRAEAGGISHFGVGQGPLLWSDPYQEKVAGMRAAGVDGVSVFLSNPMTFARDIEDLSQLVAARV